MQSLIATLTALCALLIALTSAQTFTSCNPLNRTDCPVDPALSTNTTLNLTSGNFPTALWNTTAGVVSQDYNGAHFVVNQRGDSPTIKSQFYIMFGTVSVIMKAAKGVGVISSIVLESDDLDEVDWEFLGGNSTSVQTNYFGKGDNTTYDRMKAEDVSDPQNNFHNYTTVWNAQQLEWWIDGSLKRTLKYEDAKNGTRYPQTPMTVKLGIWVAGDASTGNSNGTIEWAGGVTDYKQGPFTMTVQSVYVKDDGNGKEYQYGDTSGNWQSIKTVAGDSSAKTYLSTPHTMTGKFNALSQTAKIGIVSGIAGGIGLAFIALLVCCIKSRRAGRREKAKADAQWANEQAELQLYQKKMREGDFSFQGGLIHQKQREGW